MAKTYTINRGPYNGNFFPNMDTTLEEKEDSIIYNDKIEILKQVLNILKDL